MVYYSLRTEKESEIQRVCDAGVAEQADARDLKSRDAKASYRFDPGHRHHRKDRNYYRGVEQLVARRAHNPEVVRFKSHPRNHIERPKKMPPEKPRVSSVFLVFSPFSSLFQKSVFSENKKMPIGKIDLWWGFEPMTCSFWGEFQRCFSEIRPFFIPFFKKYLLILCV